MRGWGGPRKKKLLRPPPKDPAKQGSLHSTPEHCLVNDGVPLFYVLLEKAMSQMGKMYLLRSPVKHGGHTAKSRTVFWNPIRGVRVGGGGG